MASACAPASFMPPRAMIVPTKKKFKALVTYHWRVFRAQGETAQLSISDWASRDAPGGALGQEIMCNFVQVQPYDAP